MGGKIKIGKKGSRENREKYREVGQTRPPRWNISDFRITSTCWGRQVNHHNRRPCTEAPYLVNLIIECACHLNSLYDGPPIQSIAGSVLVHLPKGKRRFDEFVINISKANEGWT